MHPRLAGVLTLDGTVGQPVPEDVRRLATAVGAYLGDLIGHVARPRPGGVPRPRSEAAGVASLL